MKQYLDLLKEIIDKGKTKSNRTGIDTKSITGFMFEHDMSTGFPLITTKRMGIKNIAAELKFFIKGLSDKTWLQERGCHIWDEWCNPEIVPYSNDEETKTKMSNEDDLGRIYGVQWRKWTKTKFTGYDKRFGNLFEQETIDQLKNIIDTLKKDPTNRRMIVMAWNPAELYQMALPPCHYGFQVLSDGEKVDLLWNQRSVDVPLGLPYNIASYGLLLELIAKEVGMKPGKLIGFLADCHIYENQLEHLQVQLDREPHELPTINIKGDENFNIFDWEYTNVELSNYEHYPSIKIPIAV